MLCYEDLPFTWDEAPFQVLNTPGTFTLNSLPYASYLGCDSLVRQIIIIKPQLTTNLPTAYLCSGECVTIGGQDYCDAGAYTVVLESALGCDSTLIVNVVVLDPKAIIEGSSVFYYGQDSATLQSVASSGTKIWSNTSGDAIGTGNTLTIYEAGTYFLSTTQTNGGKTCTARDTIVVQLDTSFLALQIGVDSIIQPINGQNNGAIYLSVESMGNQLQFGWYLNAAFLSNSEDISNLAPGVYSLIITNQLGCSIEEIFTLEGVSATQQAQDMGAWAIRPNPSSGLFEISCQAPQMSDRRILVFDPNGRLVVDLKMENAQQVIPLDLSEAPAGIYFVEIRDAVQSAWLKLMVQR